MPSTPASPPARAALLSILLAGVLTTAGLMTGPADAATAAPRPAPDPLGAMLADDWDGSGRAAVAERVRELGSAACATLSGYAKAPDPRAREHAVRALDDAGCVRLEDYRPYFGDHAPWVVDAVIAAAGGRAIAAAWPFVLQHVDDRRRLVSDGGSWTIEEAAHRALRRLTGQPIPFRPEDPPEERDRSAAAWRAWFAEHAHETPASWMDQGLAAARAALAEGGARDRIAALETLALAGGRGAAILHDALLRAPGEVEARLVCEPEEPPRVTDEVPCTLILRNLSARRVPLALGDAAIALTIVPAVSQGAGAGVGAPAPAKAAAHGKGRTGAKSSAPPTVPASPSAPPAVVPDRGAAPGAATGWAFVDLAPGTTTTRALRAGPVPAAGHYEVRASVRDLGAAFTGSTAAPADRIEATTLLRFEQ